MNKITSCHEGPGMVYAKIFAISLLTIFSGETFAHILQADPMNLHHGFLHPITGMDHLMTLLGVGYLSSLIEKKTIPHLPFLFILFMLMGAILGFNSKSYGWAELFIILTVLMVGLKIIFPHFFHRYMIWTLISFSAFCHGYAHGAEAVQLGFIGYLLGMLVASIGVLFVGRTLGCKINQFSAPISRTMVGLSVASFALLNIGRVI